MIMPLRMMSGFELVGLDDAVYGCEVDCVQNLLVFAPGKGYLDDLWKVNCIMEDIHVK